MQTEKRQNVAHIYRLSGHKILLFSSPKTTTTTTTTFLLFSFLLHHHHHISIVFLSTTTTTTFQLFSLHHHISIVFLPPPPPLPPHFYCFLIYSWDTFLSPKKISGYCCHIRILYLTWPNQISPSKQRSESLSKRVVVLLKMYQPLLFEAQDF